MYMEVKVNQVGGGRDTTTMYKTDSQMEWVKGILVNHLH